MKFFLNLPKASSWSQTSSLNVKVLWKKNTINKKYISATQSKSAVKKLELKTNWWINIFCATNIEFIHPNTEEYFSSKFRTCMTYQLIKFFCLMIHFVLFCWLVGCFVHFFVISHKVIVWMKFVYIFWNKFTIFILQG